MIFIYLLIKFHQIGYKIDVMKLSSLRKELTKFILLKTILLQ